MIKPVRLQRGDGIGLVTPASPPLDPGLIDRAADTIRKLGFKPILGRAVRCRHGYLAGSDRQRAADLMRMFLDRRVTAIFCIRGGYGAGRILADLDYDVIRSHPKIFVGYSDITAVHSAIIARAGVVTFHGPMLGPELTKAEVPMFTVQTLLRTTMEAVPAASILTGNGTRVSAETWRRGKAEGRLMGGNLAVLSSLIGTPFQPSFKNAILFLEDIDEAPYRVDRYLTTLLHAGVLGEVSGVALGSWKNCVDPRAERAKEYRQSVEEVLRERLLPLKVPVLARLPFGHVLENATLPVGVPAYLDADRGDLVIMESAVS